MTFFPGKNSNSCTNAYVGHEKIVKFVRDLCKLSQCRKTAGRGGGGMVTYGMTTIRSQPSI